MENKPRKSKALLITFIIVLLLLVAGYYLFKKSGQISNSSSLNKIFAPLFGSSKSKDINVIDTGNGNNTNTGTTTKKITGVVITDANGNKIVQAQAGEDLKKGDVLYIAGFNTNNNPIVKKAIANDPAKALVFGVAGEDIANGQMGNVIINGVLTGVNTNKKEGTSWKVKDPLYLSDKIFGGMTKNSPVTPSLSVLVGSVLKVDTINGSINIGDLQNNSDLTATQKSDIRKLYSDLLNSFGNYMGSDFLGITFTPQDFQDYWKSVFEDNSGGTDYTPGGGTIFPPYNPIDQPAGGDGGGGSGGQQGGGSGGDSNPGGDNNTKPQCSDGIDNDGDGLIDAKDPQCHTDGNADNASTYDETINSESGITSGTEQPNKCLLIEQNPLTFTADEKARLAALLRKFYLISSTLRTENDITTAYNNIDQQKQFISQIEDLTKQCYLQTNDNSGFLDFCYRNPSLCTSSPSVEFTMNANNKYQNAYNTKHGNPWFSKSKSGTFPYTSSDVGYANYDENTLKTLGYSCKDVSGYYYGTLERDVTITRNNLIAKLEETTLAKIGNFLTFGLAKKAVNSLFSTKTVVESGTAGESCSKFNDFPEYNICNFTGANLRIRKGDLPEQGILEAGCQWKYGVDFPATERLLNIW